MKSEVQSLEFFSKLDKGVQEKVGKLINSLIGTMQKDYKRNSVIDNKSIDYDNITVFDQLDSSYTKELIQHFLDFTGVDGLDKQ